MASGRPSAATTRRAHGCSGSFRCRSSANTSAASMGSAPSLASSHTSKSSAAQSVGDDSYTVGVAFSMASTRHGRWQIDVMRTRSGGESGRFRLGVEEFSSRNFDTVTEVFGSLVHLHRVGAP